MSLLQSAQMNGLAIVLNSLMSRGGETVSMSFGNSATPYVDSVSNSLPHVEATGGGGSGSNGNVMANRQ